jgi:glutathione reductase (NADPH)
MKCGLTKKQLDETVGIHPTVAEEFTLLTKLNTEEAKKEEC